MRWKSVAGISNQFKIFAIAQFSPCRLVTGFKNLHTTGARDHELYFGAGLVTASCQQRDRSKLHAAS